MDQEKAGALLVVLVDVEPKVEDAFNDWYDNQHVPEVTACPGFLSGRRARAASSEQSPRYVAIYELSDVSALESVELERVRGWGAFSDSIRNFQRLVFELSGSSREVDGG